MRKNNIKNISVILFFISAVFVSACGQTGQGDKAKSVIQASTDVMDSGKKYKVIFIELGSVRCIPCQQMQPVMKSIEAKYGKEVKVDFHDVWTEAGKPYGVKYGIEAIPTQVFLDETGKEYYRHVGYFPEEELVKVLQLKGVKTELSE
jgi:thioredoxin 1